MHRPEIEHLLNPLQLLPLGHKTVVHPFEQPRHRVENMRLDLFQGSDDLSQVTHIINAHPLVLEMVIDAPLIDMTQGQEADHPVFPAQMVHFRMRREIGDQIAVRKHHPFGHPRGSGGINNGRQIFRLYFSHDLLQPGFQRLPVLVPCGHDLPVIRAPRHLLKGIDLLQRRNPVHHRLELFVEFGIAHNHIPGP